MIPQEFRFLKLGNDNHDNSKSICDIYDISMYIWDFYNIIYVLYLLI